MPHAASFDWTSMLPPRPMRRALRLFVIYLSVGLAAAGVAGVLGVIPGSPLRALLTASAPPLPPPVSLGPPASPPLVPRFDAEPAGAAPPAEVEEPSQQIVATPSNSPLVLAQASHDDRHGMADLPGIAAGRPAERSPAAASGRQASWQVQLGAFHGRSEAVKAAEAARRRIGAGEALVTERLGRKDAVYLAQVSGLTVPQARSACGADAPACLIFAPAEAVAPDLLPPNPAPPDRGLTR